MNYNRSDKQKYNTSAENSLFIEFALQITGIRQFVPYGTVHVYLYKE